MLNIRSAKKLVTNKDCIRRVEWTDHVYSSYIKKFNLVLKVHKDRTAYWCNSDKTKELVILYNNTDFTKKAFLAGY